MPVGSQPKPADAADAIRVALGAEARAVQRFPTGLAHFVYDVELADGGRVVARLAGDANADELRAGVEWSKRRCNREEASAVDPGAVDRLLANIETVM